MNDTNTALKHRRGDLFEMRSFEKPPRQHQQQRMSPEILRYRGRLKGAFQFKCIASKAQFLVGHNYEFLDQTLEREMTWPSGMVIHLNPITAADLPKYLDLYHNVIFDRLLAGVRK